MYRVSGSLTMSAAAISSADIGSRRQAFGFSAPLRYAFSATTAARVACGDAVFAHVAGDLGAEELGGDHQPGLAVSLGQAPVLRRRVERAARVFVEADREGDVGGPERIALTAENSALPPVAQPFLTLVNGIPVKPSSATRVSASPGAVAATERDLDVGQAIPRPPARR